MKLYKLFSVINISLLILFITLSSIIIGYQWHSFAHYHRLDKQFIFLQTSIKVIDRLSDERAYLNMLLGETDTEPTAVQELKRRQGATDIAVQQLSMQLNSIKVPDSRKYYHSYRAWLADLREMRYLTQSALTTPVILRSSNDIKKLIQSHISLTQPIEDILLFISDNILRQDSNYYHPIETLIALTILRNQAGLLGSTMMPSIISQRRLNSEEKTFYYQTKYQVEQRYAAFIHHVIWINKHQSVISPSSQKLLDKKYFQLALPSVNYLFLIGENSGRYHISSKSFTEQYAAHLDAAKHLRYNLLQERISITRQAKQRAFNIFMLTIFGCLAIGLGLLYLCKIMKLYFLHPIIEANHLLSMEEENLYKRTLLPVYKRRNEASQMLIQLHTLRMKYFSDKKS